MILFSKTWAMPSKDTFSIKPIGDFVQRYLAGSKCSIDPFARNNQWASYTNDINPQCAADYCMDARDFLKKMAEEFVMGDLIILDPPYSPRQVAEHYKAAGLKASQQDTQNAKLYKQVKDLVLEITGPGSVVLSFGWNSSGMGQSRGFELIEVMLCSHGGAHNDTICVAERRIK